MTSCHCCWYFISIHVNMRYVIECQWIFWHVIICGAAIKPVIVSDHINGLPQTQSQQFFVSDEFIHDQVDCHNKFSTVSNMIFHEPPSKQREQCTKPVVLFFRCLSDKNNSRMLTYLNFKWTPYVCTLKLNCHYITYSRKKYMWHMKEYKQ